MAKRMSDETRGRGRGRGRGQRPPAGGAGAQTGPPQPSARGGAPRGQPPSAQPPQPAMPGRATSRGAVMSRQQSAGDSAATLTSSMRGLTVAEGAGAAAGGPGGDTIGRGNLRGNRQIERPALVRTKPETCTNKQGVTGQKVNCTANYFAIETKADWHLYQYRVDFNPEEDRTLIKRALLAQHRAKLGGGFVFDGTMLFTHQRLAQPLELVSKRNHDEAFITMTVRMVDKDAIKFGDQTYLQVLNIVVRKCIANLDMTLLGRNYYDPKAKISIPEFKLELWPGYLTSMRQHEQNFLLCVEIVHKVLRQDTAWDLLRESQQKDSRNFRDIFRNNVIGQIVMTSYGNPATYKVDDVDFDSCPEKTFDMKGKQTSYLEYYQTKYGTKIRDGRQPMLVSRPKARDERGGRGDQPIYLVPELCRMTGITDDMRNNFNLMRAMADRTRMDSRTRQDRLMVFQQRFTKTQKNVEELKNWNLSLSKNLVNMQARILPPEKIIFGNNKIVNLDRGPDWTNSFRNTALLATRDIDNWVVVCLRDGQREIQEFVGMLQQSARGMGMRIDQPNVVSVDDDRVNSCVGVLDRVLSRELPKIVLFPVSNNRADRYSAIKRKTYIDRAVPSQVVVMKTLRKKGLMSIATKVAIQMACKIGGMPWTVEIPIKNTMVVGYDVCHDAKQKTKSYGALVASLNATWTRYYSSVTHHQHGEEIFKDLPINIIKAITKYQQHNGNQLPNRLLIYRDGVGEGQINKVFSREVEDVVTALQQTYGEQAPKMAFVIVTKRLNSRFFMGNENPPAGTVVDDVITCPEKYDFFLIPQSVRQGTVSPAGFNVIYDKSGLAADHMQRITYKLCHLYFNWSGTVRVPAPCQYAHKLAFLCSQNLHGVPNEDLSDLLYFL
nr:piwi [Sogatella furcifera]